MYVLGLVIWCASIVAASHDSNPCKTPDNEAGTCIPVESCSEFDFLKTQNGPISRETMELLRALHCGFEGSVPLICCKAIVTTTLPTHTDVPDSSENSINTTTLPSSTEVTKITTRIPNVTDVTEHRNIGLINQEFCGQSSIGQRIINGNETEIMEYPWMALLEYRTKTGYKFLCGGTLINVNYVLTAAHCIIYTREQILVRVRLGEHDYSTEEDCEGEGIDHYCAPPYQNIDVERAIKYPLYSAQRKVDDIGLLRLATPADITEAHVRPICLPVNEESTRNLDGLKMIVAGWGATETGFLSRKLLKVSIDVMSNEKCQKKYTEYNTNLTNNQMCAGGSALGLDSCKGDSGGPLMSYGICNSRSSMIQYGIVSFGVRICGTAGVPAVYTRVTNYMDWILDNIKP